MKIALWLRDGDILLVLLGSRLHITSIQFIYQKQLIVSLTSQSQVKLLELQTHLSCVRCMHPIKSKLLRGFNPLKCQSLQSFH